MGLSLQPYSQVGYDISEIDVVENVGEVERRFVGSGGSYQFFWSNSLKYKNLSFGLNLGYLFGKIRYDREVNFLNYIDDYQDLFRDELGFSGFLWNAGLMYEIPLNDPEPGERVTDLRSITFGLHGHTNLDFTATTQNLYLRRFASGSFGDLDTLTYISGLRNAGTIPHQFGIGMMYRKGDILRFGLNYNFQDWSAYRNEAKPEELDKSWTLSAGASFRPDFGSFNRLWRRIDYRIGFAVKKDPRQINGTELNEYVLSIGAGVPFILNRKISFLNFGLDYGKRNAEGVLSNSYFRLSLGVTLNDNDWFIKRKFN
jgi:hypothetical protein